MIILSIDSGIEKTGFAIFKDSRYVLSGLIKTDKTNKKEQRLQTIYDKVRILIRKNLPNKIILEQLFFFRNQKTVITIGQAQGILLLLAAQHNISVEFLTPLQIKSIITGYGKADKKAIQKMLSLTLAIPTINQDDEADAIACGLAYCYLNKKLIE